MGDTLGVYEGHRDAEWGSVGMPAPAQAESGKPICSTTPYPARGRGVTAGHGRGVRARAQG